MFSPQMSCQTVSEDDFRNILRTVGGIMDEAVIDAVFAEVRLCDKWYSNAST